jgi:hypothetical protein
MRGNGKSGSLWRYSLFSLKTALGVNTVLLLIRGLFWGGGANAAETDGVDCYEIAIVPDPPVTAPGPYNDRAHPAFNDLEAAETELNAAIDTYEYDPNVYNAIKERVEKDVNILLAASEIDTPEADKIRAYFAVRLDYYKSIEQFITCYEAAE